MLPVWSMTRCFLCWITFSPLFFFSLFLAEIDPSLEEGYPWRLK